MAYRSAGGFETDGARPLRAPRVRIRSASPGSARVITRAARPHCSLRWLAMMLAALVSLTWQSLAVQTHVHPAGTTAAARAATDVPSLQLPRRGSTPDTPLDCPLCRQQAEAGTLLLAAPPAIVPGAAAFVAFLVARSLPWHGHRHSHGWRSRGPPRFSPILHP